MTEYEPTFNSTYRYVIKSRLDFLLLQPLILSNYDLTQSACYCWEDVFVLGNRKVIEILAKLVDCYGNYGWDKDLNSRFSVSDPTLSYISELQEKRHMYHHGITYILLRDFVPWLEMSLIRISKGDPAGSIVPKWVKHWIEQ